MKMRNENYETDNLVAPLDLYEATNQRDWKLAGSEESGELRVRVIVAAPS